MGRLTLALLFLVSVPWAAQAQTIGVFADSAGTDCSIDVPFPGPPVSAYIVFTGFDIAPGGVAAPVFRVSGLPSGWQASFPTATVFDDLFGDGGQVLASCSSEPGFFVEVVLTPASVATATLSVVTHLTDPLQCSIEQSCPMPCPRYCTCADFGYCMCVTGVATSINGPGCEVAVEEKPWALVKRLYRQWAP